VIYRLPPLNALRVFEAAARHLSFKEAAAELHITQAAVSHQVKSLEEYLGVRLFRRSGRGVQLTDAARACLPKLLRGFDALAAAVETIRERGEEGRARDHRAAGVHRALAHAAACRFSKREPKIELHVFALEQDGRCGSARSRRRWSATDLRTRNPACRSTSARATIPAIAPTASACPMAAVASPTSNPPDREPEDLKAPRCCTTTRWRSWPGGNAGGSGWRRPVADRVDADRGPHFSSNILSLEAASQKLGVALALRPLVNADIASGRLVAPFDIEVKPGSAYYLVCPEVIADRPAVAAFRKWLSRLNPLNPGIAAI
jgi:LysR family glycine cleavage system transcriptional activator